MATLKSCASLKAKGGLGSLPRTQSDREVNFRFHRVVSNGNGTAEHEGFLIGNRAGLELMRRKLDEALDLGQSAFEEGSIEFLGIRRVDRNPRDDSANRPGGFRDSLALLGCALVALLFIAVLLAGLVQIWSWLT